MSAFTDLINNAVPGQTLVIPPSLCIVDQPLNIRNPLVFDPTCVLQIDAPIKMMGGTGIKSSGPTKFKSKRSGNMSTFTICGPDVTLQDFNLDCSAAVGGWEFMLDTTAGLNRVDIKNVTTDQSPGLIADNSGPGLAVSINMDDIIAYRHRGRASWLTKAFAYISLDGVTIDYVNTSSLAAANIPVWVIQGAQGIELKSCDVTGNAGNPGMAAQYAFYFNNCEAVRLQTVMADTCGGFGFWFGGCNYVQGDIVNTSLCGDMGMVFCNGTRNVQLNNVIGVGRKGLPQDLSKPIFYTDGTTDNINIGLATTIANSGSIFGGAAAGAINFNRLVQR